jgi:hypothetical protein
MRHIAVLVMSVVVALSTATPTALMGAQGPPTNADDTFEIPAGELCEFGIHFDVSGKMKTIELPGGRTIFTFPGLSATLTNLDHLENQETLRITGSFHQTVLENGDVKTVCTGRTLLGDPEAGFGLAIGNFSIVFDAAGNLVQSLSGQG